MRRKGLIFVPYQDSDNFLSDGILTREFAMLYIFYLSGYQNVINVKKPRTVLDKKRYEVHEDFYPNGTVEAKVKKILDTSETIQYKPFVNLRQIVERRGWWNTGYAKTIKLMHFDKEREYLVYSDNPFAVEILSYLKEKGCKIYFDVMDNFAIHPSLKKMEREIALLGYKKIFEFADCISANSLQTCDYMSDFTDKHIYLIKNGVFENNECSDCVNIPQIKQIQNRKKNYRRCVGYIGKLGLRLDADLIDSVSNKCPDVLFVFVGNYLKGQINKKLIELFDSRDNIMHLDGVPSAYVYAILNEFDILSIPHSVGKNENGGDPLKLYQYLTRNKPIISTSILGVDEFSDTIEITNEAERWIQFINEASDNCLYRNLLDFTWESRVSPIMKELEIK